MTRLLVVEDDNSVRNTVVTFLELENYDVDSVASTREALARLQSGKYDIVLSDIYLDERTGLDVLEAARAANPSGAVILMTGRGTMETVMSATSGGAFDYIAKPFELDRLLETIRRAEASLKPAETSDDEDVEIDDLPETEMIASSAVMVDIYKTISRIAPLMWSGPTLSHSGCGHVAVSTLPPKHGTNSISNTSLLMTVPPTS